MTTPKRLDKQYFFEDPKMDIIINAITGLATELSVVRERLDTVERILDENGVVTQDLIETYKPGADVAKHRLQTRMAIINAALGPFKDHFSSRAEAVRKTPPTP